MREDKIRKKKMRKDYTRGLDYFVEREEVSALHKFVLVRGKKRLPYTSVYW